MGMDSWVLFMSSCLPGPSRRNHPSACDSITTRHHRRPPAFPRPAAPHFVGFPFPRENSPPLRRFPHPKRELARLRARWASLRQDHRTGAITVRLLAMPYQVIHAVNVSARSPPAWPGVDRPSRYRRAHWENVRSRHDRQAPGERPKRPSVPADQGDPASFDYLAPFTLASACRDECG